MGLWGAIKGIGKQIVDIPGDVLDLGKGIIGYDDRAKPLAAFQAPGETFDYDPAIFNLPGSQGKKLYNINTTQSDASRANQMQAADMFQQRLSGQSPSLAGTQFDQARQNYFRSILGAQASAGGNPLAQRALLASMADKNSALTGQYGGQAVSEQGQAGVQLGNLLSQGRGQDINLAQSQAQGDLKARLLQQQSKMELQRMLAEDAMNRARIRVGLSQTQNAANTAGNAALMGTLGSIGASFFSPKTKTDSPGMGGVDTYGASQAVYGNTQKGGGGFFPEN